MNKKDYKRNYFMLDGRFAKKGYDWWWHNFTAVNEETGEEKSFFIEYFTINPSHAKDNGGEEPILGQNPLNIERKFVPSYVMVKCGWWGKDAVQLHHFIPWKDVTITNGNKIVVSPNGQKKLPAKEKVKTFSISSNDFYCSEINLKGNVNITPEQVEKSPEMMCDSGSMKWNISIDKNVAFNVGYGASSIFRKLKAFEMYWHAQGMKSIYSGNITANGQRYVIKKSESYGYSDKNWGSNFTSPWVWLSSNDLVSKISGKRLENSVFDIGGGCPKVFGIPLRRKLLSDFWYEGKSYEFNFSKFWTICRTKFDCKETDTEIRWYVRQETTKYLMETFITCKKEDMLLVNYESPDGKKRHNRLWNGGTGTGNVKLLKKSFGGKLHLIDDITVNHIGCEYGEYDK